MRRPSVTYTLLLDADLVPDLERIQQGHLQSNVPESEILKTAMRIAEEKGMAEGNKWLLSARSAGQLPRTRTGVVNMLIREAINARREKAGEPSIESVRPVMPSITVALTKEERIAEIKKSWLRSGLGSKPVKRGNKRA